MALAEFDPINPDADLGVPKTQGRRAVQSQLSLGFLHLFPFDDRGEHVSMCFPLKSPDSELISVLKRALKQLLQWYNLDKYGFYH